jgi:ATPase
LIGKVELGLVSQVLDTVLHVEAGKIQQVLELRMTVKPPSGMQEELARPVIEVVEFPSGNVTHEMFAFGSELAVVPVTERNQQRPVQQLAQKQLVHTIRQWAGVNVRVRFTSDASATVYAPKNMISTLVGRGGDNVRALQDQLGGLRLSIESLDEMPGSVDVSEHAIWDDDQDRRAYQSKAYEQHGRSKKSRKGRRR